MYSEFNGCPFETGDRYSTIRYSKLSTSVTWQEFGKLFQGITYL